MDIKNLSVKEIFLLLLVGIGVIYFLATKDSRNDNNPPSTKVKEEISDSQPQIKSMEQVEQIVKEQRQLPENQNFVKNFQKELKQFQSNSNPKYRSIEANELDYNSIGLVITYDNDIAATQAPKESEDLVRFIIQYSIKHGKRPASDPFFAFVQANMKFKGETEERYAMLGHALYNANTDSIYWEAKN